MPRELLFNHKAPYTCAFKQDRGKLDAHWKITTASLSVTSKIMLGHPEFRTMTITVMHEKPDQPSAYFGQKTGCCGNRYGALDHQMAYL